MQDVGKGLASSKLMAFPDESPSDKLMDDESEFAQMQTMTTTLKGTINNVLENPEVNDDDFPVLKSSDDGAKMLQPLPRVKRQLFLTSEDERAAVNEPIANR